MAVEEILEEIEADHRNNTFHTMDISCQSLCSINDPGSSRQNSEIFRHKPVTELLKRTLSQLGFNEYESWKNAQLLSALVSARSNIDQGDEPVETAKLVLESWINNEAVRAYLDVNTHNNIRWYNKERFEDFVWYTKALNYFILSLNENLDSTQVIENLLVEEEVFNNIDEAEEYSQYQVDKLLEFFKEN